VIVTLWHRHDTGLRSTRLRNALTLMPLREERGALFAFTAMVRRSAMRPHTFAIAMLRAELP
jgi:hypothetical protein